MTEKVTAEKKDRKRNKPKECKIWFHQVAIAVLLSMRTHFR